MIHPAVSFLAFPLANVLSFQGVTLVAEALFGTATVALFTSYPTIARVAVQSTDIFSHALWPEFAQLFGQGRAGEVEFVQSLIAWMLAYAAIRGIWHVPRVLLMSTNKHIGLAGWSLAAAGLPLLLAWIFGREWRIEGVPAAMLIPECFIALVCVYLTHGLFLPKSRIRSYLS